MQKQSKWNRGFTLVELLVVMVVIGVLAAMIMVNFTGARERARDARRKQEMTEIAKALRLYYNDYQEYPDDGGNSGNIYGCGNDGDGACGWQGEFSSAGTIYMKYLPQDPLNNCAGVGTYCYTYDRVSGDEFTLMTNLENPSDPDVTTMQAKCGAGSGSEYVVCED